MARNTKRTVGLSALFLSALAAIIAGVAFAAHHGSDADVRVGAMRHDDGRVEVAVQQRDADGSWGELQRPNARFLPADVTGEWRSSSPLSLQTPEAMTSDDTDAMPEDAMPEDAMPEDAMPEDAAELYCIVHHGADTDRFWIDFELVAQQNALELGLTNVEITGEPDVEDHAAAIMDCVDRGALGIASSIPNLDGLRDALIAARSSGAYLVTFNSGADVAGLVGSTIHYGLDDRVAGELAGREFNNADVTGAVFCVVHEPNNVGLTGRCDGLESAYDGEVVEVLLPAGSLTDPMAAGEAIGEALNANQAGGVLVLNAALINTAVAVVQQLESNAQVGVIGRSEQSIVLVHGGQLLFAIADGGLAQASHVMLALKNVDSSPSIRGLLELTSSRAAETTIMLIRPLVVNQAYIENLPEGWQQQICALVEQFDQGQAPAFCDQ